MGLRSRSAPRESADPAKIGPKSTTPDQPLITVDLGPDVLVISEVQLVARKIRLERSDGCVNEDPENDEESENENEELDEDCPMLKLGPVLLVPPLTDGAETTFEVEVPVGTYDEIKLQIHKPRGANDQAFLAAHPDLEDVSIRVIGTYNGNPFTFETGLTEEEEIELEPPVVVSADGPTSFTLLLDVRGWFLNQAGTALLDPASSSQQDRSRIEQNIRSSFHAFEDEDGDAQEDEPEDQ